MSLADKVIKNTFYYILFQLFTFLFPLILTPYIISEIGEVQFGLYALVIGFIGIFSLFDLSISSSFVVFISRYFVKKDFINLNKYVNTGLFFYIIFSLIIAGTGYLFTVPILSRLNIPPELFNTSVKIFYIGLAIFFVSNAFSVFSSVLITLQKMYITSLIGLFAGVINLAGTIILLNMGFGLEGIIWIQLVIALFSNILYIFFAKRSLPEIRIGIRHIEKNPVKEMVKFGSQMQISKLASFASEKYDEFLLAYFSVLNNVTYFNIANKISRTGRMIPFQIIPQVAPVASELKSKEENEKLSELFSDISKYLSVISFPVFIFIFIFSDLIITTWMGPGFELSANILKILVAGQLFNMVLSAPGNSITPNTGHPEYQMREGLIYLGINLILSYLLIKYYGIVGAAIGNVISIFISSVYIFISSHKFFKGSKTGTVRNFFSKTLAASAVSGIIAGVIYYFSNIYIYRFEGRIPGLIYLAVLISVFVLIYTALIFKLRLFNMKDKIIIAKFIMKMIPAKFLNKSGQSVTASETDYKGELVSIFVVTYNRLGMLEKCIGNMIPTLKNINYELLIIDNASDDGTVEYLKKIASSFPEVKITLNEENIGINSKAKGAELSSGDFLIGVDDDVIDFPEGWVENMVRAYKTIPGMGYLASDVVQDETTNGAKPPVENYFKEYYDDGKVILEVGPTGGWCFMISREVYELVGKLKKFDGRIFFSEDGDYVNRIRNKGLKYGILSGVKVYHATGEFHNKEFSNVFKNKYSDFEKGDTIYVKLKTNLIKIFSIKRYISKIEELASRKQF
ncbi:MAG TPA: glycosyltransferase [Ignavibacteria bacterium]|nr:glycosyltransferase [Ignavibacteria bacterium]